jgi:hypothetical protein
MSDSVFENHNLDFKVSLIKMKRIVEGENIKEVVADTVDLNSGSVLDLEFSESSLTMGIKGAIAISNDNKILERFNISSNSPQDLYLAFDIKDLELNGTDFPEERKSLTAICLVLGTMDRTAGPVKGAIIFQFEEAFVAATRLTQSQYFDGKGADIGLGDILDNTNALELASDYNNKIYKLKSEENITAPSAEPNTRHNIKIQDKHDVAVYDALVKMVNESGVNGVPGKTPYMRFVNAISADGSVKRLLKYDAFLTDKHIEFANQVKKGGTGGEYSDVYTEKFFLGQTSDASGSDPNGSMNNKIEDYNIARADISSLRQKVWGDYNINNAAAEVDPGRINVTHKAFTDLQIDFVERELGGEDLECNLPLIPGAELRDFHLDVNTLATEEAAFNAVDQVNQKVSNKVMKSFLTLNESITLDVKGAVYREPNKFIWVDQGKDEEDYKKLWYVNSVTHKFKDGKFRNKIVATKIFGDTSLKALIANKVS